MGADTVQASPTISIIQAKLIQYKLAQQLMNDQGYKQLMYAAWKAHGLDITNMALNFFYTLTRDLYTLMNKIEIFRSDARRTTTVVVLAFFSLFIVKTKRVCVDEMTNSCLSSMGFLNCNISTSVAIHCCSIFFCFTPRHSPTLK